MKKKLAIALSFLSLGVVAATATLSSVSYASLKAANVLPTEAHIGDTIDVPSVMIEYEGAYSQSESCVITSPSGTKTLSTGTLTFTEAGKYVFTYSASFGDAIATKEAEVLCVRRPSDMFIVENATVTSEADFAYADKLDSYVGNSYRGVRVNSLESGTVTFNKIIDFSDYSKDDSIIDFIAEPSTNGKYDIGEFDITLTDADDPSNYVVIRYVDGLLGSGGNLRMTYVTARGANQKPAGYEASFDAWHYDSEQVGTTCGLTLRGLTDYQVTSGGGYLNSKIGFDYDDRAIYITYQLGTRSQTICNDLDSLKLYGANPWNGFTNGKAIVSVTTKDVGGTGGDYLIHSIGDYDLSVSELRDTDDPIIDVDFNGEDQFNLPKSKLGTSYPIFKASVYDRYDDALPVETKVTYHDENLDKDIDVSYEGDRFPTNRAGKYNVTYSTHDRCGNRASTSYQVTTVAYSDPFEIVVPGDSYSGEVYQSIALPSLDEIKTNNACGKVSLSRYLTTPSNEVVSIEGDSFEAEEVGVYKVTYLATDLLGEEVTKTVTYGIKPFTHPILVGNANLPDRFIYGFTYEIPTLNAKYNHDGKIEDGDHEVYVNGNKTTESKIVIDSYDDYVIRFVPAGDDTNALTYTIPVINPNDEAGKLNKLNYFYSNGTFASEAVSDGGAEFTVNDNSEIHFANNIASENFTVNMQINPSSVGFFSSFNIVMKDAEDSGKTLTLKIVVEGESMSMYFPHSDTKYILPCSNYEFALYYTDYTHGFADYLYSTIGEATYFDDGSVFTGFSNSLYFSFYFEGAITEVKASLLILNNQSFKTLVPKDNAGPQIVLNDDSNWAQEKGTTITIGNADAYDVLSYVKSLNVTVSDSTGKLLFNNVDATNSYYLGLSTYGNYDITYVAVDGNGKKTTRYSTICCMEREAPTLEVSSFKVDGFQVGSTFTLPTYSFKDNSGTCYLDIVLYMPSGKANLLEHDEILENELTKTSYLDEAHYSEDFVASSNSFKFTMSGKHRLRFYAHDDNGNYVYQEFAIEVK